MKKQDAAENPLSQVIGCILLVVISGGSATSAAEPQYYVKETTWQESMLASRRALKRFHAEEAAGREQRLQDLGIELGPWYSIGPFLSPNEDHYKAVFEPENKVDLKAGYDAGKLKWRKRSDWQDGEIHTLSGDGGPGEGLPAADYMYRRITCSQDTKTPVYLGSNDGIQVWFNGDRVLARDIGREAAPDQDMVELQFKTGMNELLIKVNNRAKRHSFYFSMHPGDGVKTRRTQELWRFLERDFPDQKARRQMQWEREDDIWGKELKSFDQASLAARYAQATRPIGTLADQAKQLADDVANEDQLQKLREVYYRSRLFDELVTQVQGKLQLVIDQLTYLRQRFKEKVSDVQWEQYKTKLAFLRETADTIVAQARQARTAAIEKIKQWESDLAKLHESQLPQIPLPSPMPACQPFDLKQVRLLDGPFKKAMELDRKYLHDLDSDRLLHMFRITAGLPSSAQQLGGWEKRGLRGHTMGHYLTACALMYSSTGDEELKTKADAIVAELAKCQKAFGNGYLSAFPEDGIKKVIYRTGNWWAPWYTLHKIYAGLIDMYTHCANEQALDVAKAMAHWAKSHLDNLNDQQTQHMLEVEFGGMNEVMASLYAVTRNPDHLAMARQFDHDTVFEPLAHFQDKLTGLHANTQVPKIVGAAREFELTGERYYYNIATFFWDQVVSARSYCTGGTSHHEHWRTKPHKLAEELSPATQESCVTYNMLKLTRHLFCWQPEARYADYYERALFNSILSTQDPATGMMMYFVPLASGYWKIFNTPNDSFWCCTGTGIENHAKYGDSIYFHDDNGIYVNLFIASELDWPDRGIRIRQETSFPEQQGTALIVKTEKPADLALHIRVPCWTTKGMTVRVNGDKLNVDTEPSTYLTLNRNWKDGDKVTVEMPMSLHLHKMPGDPQLAAIMYGPLVLAGELGTEGMDPKTMYSENQGVLRGRKVGPVLSFLADAGNLDAWIKPVAEKPLTFRTVDAGRPNDVTLVPYHKLFGQRYAIYWRVQPK